MSEQKLVSPLLDGFQVGDPISSHDGVRCCPAIKENSDNKYIVKILSIPASQSQLDALLLAGAFQDAAGALDYFKDVADGVVQEIKLHQQLARLDGFVPCDAWQVVPMDDNQLGYEVYLLTPYHRTLDRHLKKTCLTHLEAVNLGLDMCAALTASRRAGYLYVDLKPANVFIASDREFLIGDLGFMRLDSLKYAALPTKYRSAYTAPEMADDLATISQTADVYALGLMLYQVYNDGQLPGPADDGLMAAPANADYEMAEIILKACAQEPGDRWQDPAEMGQALVSYMKRNTVNDVPIVPPAASVEPEEELVAEVVDEIAEETAEQTEAAEETAEAVCPEEEPIEEAEDAEAADETQEETETEEIQQTPAEESVEESQEEENEPVLQDAQSKEETEPEQPQDEEETEAESPVAEELAFIEELESDDADEVIEDAALSEEASEILAQAEELVSHEIPDPVVVTTPQLPEEEPAQEESQSEEEETPAEEDEDDEDNDEVEIPIAIPSLEPMKKKGRKWLITAIILVLLAAAAYGASHYYTNYYLVPVESIALSGGCNTITAQISVPFDEGKITAVCTDTYGNTATSPVVGGYAYFDGLNPGTQYTVTLQVDSFNKFTGNSSATFTTDQQIKVVSMSATTGSEDGSVILSFTVDGYDPQNWTVEYGDDQTLAFTGHMVTIPGLTVGDAYTFSLRPTEATDVALVGETSLEFTVSPVILAQNVAAESFENGVLTVVWSADAEVAAWTVRCTGNGVDETVTVTDTRAQFTGMELNKTYSIEILAEGMTQSTRTELNITPLAISNLETAMVNAHTLRVTWEYTGDAPAAGWTVNYSIDGQAMDKLTTDTNAADLPLVIPGASYEISVSADSAASDKATFKVPAAEKYAENGFSASGMSYSFCVTPEGSNWTHEDVEKYGSTFKAGQPVSMVVYAKESVDKSDKKIQVLYVVRDEDGKVITKLCNTQTKTWDSLWNDRYFYPTLSATINEKGSYTFEVYFDGALALKKTFTMS